MEFRLKYLAVLLALAVLFWVELFALRHFNFWAEMVIAASVLAGLGLYFNHRTGPDINFRLYYWENRFLIIGVLSAGILYGVFFAGDKLSNLIFNFADKQINNVYSNKTLLDPNYIGLLLFFIIGPAEEVFWRGFVQDVLAHKLGDMWGWVAASLIYGAVHLVAWNLMLFVAALVCGFFWGYLFKRYRSIWPGIISHAIWDVTIFVILPVR